VWADYTEEGRTKSVTQRAQPKEKYLAMVLALSFVLGMGVAFAVYWLWRSGAVGPGFHNALSAVALLFCPPFVLSVAVGPTLDSDLALALIVGTIVFANAFLYAGVAAGAYFVVSVMAKRSGTAGR